MKWIFHLMFHFKPRSATLAAAVALLSVTCLPARALDYQIHGFAAQGYTLSDGNNYYGDSIRGGSTDFYELGLNGAASLLPNLLVSAQGLMRRAGSTDEEGLRLDYAQVDYRFLSSTRYDAGLRLGRVKNPLGFYNDTSDVIFTRPGITLPDSIYYSSEGLRSILFSRDGAQLYGGAQLGNHYLTAEGNYALPSTLSSKEEQQLFGGADLPVNIRLENFHVGRLQDEWNGGTLKFALSYLHGKLEIEPNSLVPLNGVLTANFWVASARYNASSFALTGEYLRSGSRIGSSVLPQSNTAGDGFYLQGEYRFMPKWTAMARYNASFVNLHDRDGRAYAAETGGNRYSQFSHDETLGVNWQPDEHWGVWAEYHLIQGTAAVPLGDNEGRSLVDHWDLFQLMAGYRF